MHAVPCCMAEQLLLLNKDYAWLLSESTAGVVEAVCVFTQVFNGTELALEVALARLPPGAQPRRDEASGAAQMPIQVLLIGVCFQGRIDIRQLLASLAARLDASASSSWRLRGCRRACRPPR